MGTRTLLARAQVLRRLVHRRARQREQLRRVREAVPVRPAVLRRAVRRGGLRRGELRRVRPGLRPRAPVHLRHVRLRLTEECGLQHMRDPSP